MEEFAMLLKEFCRVAKSLDSRFDLLLLRAASEVVDPMQGSSRSNRRNANNAIIVDELIEFSATDKKVPCSLA